MSSNFENLVISTYKKHLNPNKPKSVSTVTLGLIEVNAGKKQRQKRTKLGRILLDSGSSGCLVSQKMAKRLETVKTTPSTWATKSGTFETDKLAMVPFCLFELHPDKQITWEMHVDETEQLSDRYDIIIGRDLMLSLGLNLLFGSREIEWDNATAPMRNPKDFSEEHQKQLEEEVFGIDPTEEDIIEKMTEQKYSPADLPAEVERCTHLNNQQQQELLELLQRFSTLFDGSLGTWNTKPVELELKEGATPYYGRPYPVPKSQEEKLKSEIKRLEKYKVLRKINDSEWGMPSFTIVKKDGVTLRSIADLRELNKRIKRKPFPLPKIQELLLKLENFQYGTSLDLNMGYYHILLSPQSARMCTVVFPWGKYEYLRLPMGLCNAPDIFQEKMGDLFHDLEFVRAYIDDLLVISKGSFHDHLRKLEQVFIRLTKAGLKVNASKSSFAAEALEYLGYWISREGIRPLSKKVEAMNNIATPRTKKQVRSFIGMVNHYRDMWARRSDILAPLSELTSKKAIFKWLPKHQQAFDEMKRIIARETQLAFPDFSQPFHIHTDASDVQL